MTSQEHTLEVKSLDGKKVGSYTISAAALGGVVRHRLIKEVALLQERNLRQGSANTKTRGEIRATSQKPWRQKGTGRARAGNRNSNIWRGGSVAHGPRPRSFLTEVPKKIKRRSLASVLLGKIIDNEITLVDEIKFSEIKTKKAIETLSKLNVTGKVLIANHEFDENSLLSFRNIPTVSTLLSTDLNVLSILRCQQLVVTKEGLEKLVDKLDLSKESEKEEMVGAS